MIVLQVRSIEANRSLAPIMGGLVKIKDSGETVDIGGRQSVMVSLFPDPDCERIVLFCPDCVFLFRLQCRAVLGTEGCGGCNANE